MIGFLRGTVASRTPEGCFLEVGGVGYKIGCSTTTLAGLPRDGSTTRLWTHLHVRDDALTLFGFSTEEEQRMFEGLLAVAGVGPKLALQICSALPPDDLRRALITDDLAALSSVPGVGKKTAQRILLDLKERLALPDLEIVGSNGDVMGKVRSALENLGYSPGEVRAALATIDVRDDDLDGTIRTALKVLA